MGVLLLLAACGSAVTPPDDDVVGLPDRVDPPNPVDASPEPDGAPKDAGITDAPTDVLTDADGGGLHVFVTSTTATGNLGGALGANTTCKNLAVAAGLGGTWAAWLSDNPTGPNAIDRVSSAGPWHLVGSGELVAQTKTDLSSGTLKHAIDRDEKGVAVVSSRVWTGTGTDGKYNSNDCDKWTTGNSGRTATGSNHISARRPASRTFG